MHATHLASQFLTEDKTNISSCTHIVNLRFCAMAIDLLSFGACYEYGAAVLQMLFNLAKIYLFSFLYRYILVFVVFKQQNLKH